MLVHSLTKPIPGIQELPLVGSMFDYRRDRLGVFLRVLSECGDIGRLHYGPFGFLLLNTPELAHTVLVEKAYEFDKGEGMQQAFRPIVGNGLFTSEGEFHRKQRKVMAPSFQPRHIASYADAMVAYSEQIERTWRDEQTLIIDDEMTHLTMSIVGKVLFNTEVFTEADELGHAMAVVLAYVNYRLSTFFPIPLSWPVPRSQHAREALAVLDTRIQKMIDERRAHPEAGNDFLSVLLTARDEDGKAMSDKQIRDEALTLFAAGHETTATALIWAWYSLAKHPEIYQRMLHEVDTVLQGRSPSYSDLPSLPYTLQVFKESMRLYPPAYAVARAALHDLEINGYPVRKGELVVITTYAIHQRPDFYPEPEKFDPERFTPEREKQLPRYAYMPFGAGSRICIGNHFAMMEGHLLLATLAQRVRFELVPGQRIEPDPSKTITIRPKYPIQMIVHRRNI